MKGKDQKRERQRDGWRQEAPDYSRPTAASEQYGNLGNRVSMLHLCVEK